MTGIALLARRPLAPLSLVVALLTALTGCVSSGVGSQDPVGPCTGLAAAAQVAVTDQMASDLTTAYLECMYGPLTDCTAGGCNSTPLTCADLTTTQVYVSADASPAGLRCVDKFHADVQAAAETCVDGETNVDATAAIMNEELSTCFGATGGEEEGDCCATDADDSCGWNGDGACDEGCAWGEDVDCAAAP